MSVAVADINGDSKPDLIVAGAGDGDVSVLLNAATPGALAFAAPQTFAAGGNPVNVVVADLDGEGTPDLVAVDRGSGLNVLLGNGDGSFRGPSVLTGGNGPAAVAVADFNRDGHLDAAVANAEQDRVAVALGRGDGTFALPTLVPVGARPLAVVVADLNNDGKPDLVVANFASGTVGVLRGNGDGTFRPQETYPVGAGPVALAVADLTGDGALDIVVANNGDDTLGVLLGNGDGSFQIGPTNRVGRGTPTGQVGLFAGAGPVALAVADLTGDGTPDVVVTDALDNSVNVLLGNGDGTFRIGQQQTVLFQPGAVRVADVTGDGVADVVVANPAANTVGLLRGNSDGTFQVEQVFAVGRRPTAVAVADVNGDGKPDLVATNADDATVSVLVGQGGGAFQLQRTFATGQEPLALAVFDANGDGQFDLVTGNFRDDTLTSLLGNGDGTFAPATPANSVAAANTTQLVDFDRDGMTDSVTLDGSGRVLYRRGLGANQFAPPQALNPASRPARAFAPLFTSTGWAVATADIAPSGLVPGQPIYTVSLYTLSDRSGRVALSTPLLPTGLAATDLTGDGRDDIVVAGALDGAIQIAFQNPDATFQLRTTLPTGATPSAITFADVNGDNRPDVLVSNQASGDVSVFFNDDQRTFGTHTRRRAGTSASVIATTSTITTVAGNGFLPYSGDAGPATAATVSLPAGVAVDAVGNLFVADTVNNVVRRVAAGSGVITTVAGTGVAGFAGDGGAATAARLNNPTDVAVDAAGNLFIADRFNNALRRVDARTGIITTVAGTGVAGFAGDGGAATAAQLNNPQGVAIDAAGNLFIADAFNNAVRRVSANTGLITTVAGTGQGGYSGDGGAATAARFNRPTGVAVDAAGNLFVADAFNHVVRRVAVGTGVVTTIAGTGVAGFAGNGVQATTARLNNPTDVAIDAAGILFIADSFNHLIRRVNTETGTITAIVGTGQVGFTGDGGPATAAQLDVPQGVAIDATGNLFIADAFNNAIRKVGAETRTITTVAGNGLTRAAGNGGLATAAQLFPPPGVAVDAAGNLFVPDSGNNMIRKVAAATGVVTFVAGNAEGIFGYSGDGGPATAARLNFPEGAAVDAAGNVFIADTGNHVIRKVAAGSGVITTVAGTGTAGYSGDGSAATAARLNRPKRVAVDAVGNLFVADTVNNVVRRVDARTGIITTVAGTGVAGFAGDGGAATAAQLSGPTDVAVDAAGNLFIADTVNNVVRRVDARTGIITTVAGTGVAGFAGDGGAATTARLSGPKGVAVNATGDVLIADSGNNAIRRVDADTGLITTVVGDSLQGAGYAGDGGPATAARLSGPSGIAVSATGDLFIADTGNSVIRQVALARSVVSSADQTVALAVSDFTGDGRPDLLTVNRGTRSFAVLPGDGAGGFGAPRAALTTVTGAGLGVHADPGPVAVGDFNTANGLAGTGADDVAVLMKDAGEVWVFTNNGDGTFRQTSRIPVGPGATGLAVTRTATGLFNLQVGNTFGDVLTLVGNGDGTFQPVRLTGRNTSIAVQAVGAGSVEALVGDQFSDQVTVQASLGGGFQFAPVPLVLDGTTATALAPTDPTTTQFAPGAVVWAPLDRDDARADAIVIASGSNSVLVYRRLADVGGRPVFAPPVSFAVGTNPVSVTVADTNADGVRDLLVANKGSNDVSVLFGSHAGSGDWVGTPGPRLKSAGSGPIAVDLVANPTSPEGRDLVVTNQDGTMNVLPGRGQGFFDDRAPQVVSLGSPLAQPPTFGPGNGIGFAVTTDDALVRFSLTDPATPVTTITGSGVRAAQALPDGRVVQVMTGGTVELITPGQGGSEVLVPLGGLPQDPSALAVVALGSSDLGVLVTSEGSSAVFAFVTVPDPVQVLPFETRGGLAAVDSPLAFVTTLVTGIPSGVAVNGSVNGPASGALPLDPLLFGAAADPGRSVGSRFAGLADDEFLPTAGEEFASVVFLEDFDEDDGAPDFPEASPDTATGTTDGLKQLVDEVRGKKAAAEQATPTGVAELIERLLKAVRELPDDPPHAPKVPEGEVRPSDAPVPPAAEDGTETRDTPLSTDAIATANGRARGQGRADFAEWNIPVDVPPALPTPREAESDDVLPDADVSPFWLLTLVPALASCDVVRRRAFRAKPLGLPEEGV